MRKHQEGVWESERKFFDRQAEGSLDGDLSIDPLALKRYQIISNSPAFPLEFMFKLAGNLSGKKVLDLGCGEGIDSVLIAKLGANVVGIDISPKSIEVAKRRAEVNGVSEKVSFICSPVEKAVLTNDFDLVWGDSILHHILPELDSTMTTVIKHLKPGGMAIFKEPIVLNKTIRKLRFMLPIHTEVTIGERPLEKGDIRIIQGHLKDIRCKYFNLFLRFGRILLEDENLERASLVRASLVKAIASFDKTLQMFKIFNNLYGVVVIWGYKSHK